MANGPGKNGEMFDHLFSFPNETEAKKILTEFQADGEWIRSFVFPDVRIILAPAIVGEDGSISPQRELGGYRVLVVQDQPRLDLWEKIPELEAIGDAQSSKAGLDFYVKVRPRCEGLLPLMSPQVSGGGDYNHRGNAYLALSLIDTKARYIDRDQFATELNALDRALQDLHEKLAAAPKRNDPEAMALEDDLGLMLALLKCKFVNANALERLTNTTLRQIRDRAFNSAVDIAVNAAISASIVLLMKAWATH